MKLGPHRKGREGSDRVQEKRRKLTKRKKKLQEIAHQWLYSSSFLVTITQSRKMRWADHVARIRNKRHA